MRAHLRKFAVRREISGFAALLAAMRADFHGFTRDESGSYVIIAAVAMPVLVGAAGLATEATWWFYSQKNMLSAADSAAVSAATATSGVTLEGKGVAAAYGFVDGANGVTVTVNKPPASGSHTASADAVEVIITRQQSRLFSSLFSNSQVVLTARAVALKNDTATGCVLGLSPTASPGVSVKGSAQLNLLNCSLYADSSGSPALDVSGSASISAGSVYSVGDISGTSGITTTNGIKTGVSAMPDPYANVSPPAPGGCDYNNKFQVKNATTLTAGVYCGDIAVNAGATLTLNPGIYYLNGSSLTVSGNATITGDGVTLVFTSTSSSWGSANIGSNANVSLSAPTSGSTQGIVMYGDRNMPTGTSFQLTGGGTQNLAGAIYLPKADLSFSGGNGTSTTCTQIIGDTVTITGNSNVSVDCSAFGTKAIGVTTAQLVE